jgi:hypothetical protein
MRRAYCSHTAQPNTPESDKLPEVEHVVFVKLNSDVEEKVLINASDPMVAINKVNSLDDVTYNNLKRI